MSHRTMIGGTAYEISGGKTLINGTAYSIKSGKTLVDGTAYEVGFGPAMCTVQIAPYSNYAYFVIDGITYNSGYGSTITTLEVPIGTVVTCKLATQDDKYAKPYLRVNGINVTLKSDFSYDYTVVGNATLYGYNSKSGDGYRYGYIEITET